MSSEKITVVYKWTAKPGKLDSLSSIYRDVTQAMHDNEPGALAVDVFVSEDESAIYVRDEFQDAEALGFHLSQTATAHFPALLDVAEPGAFYFFGPVPAAMQQATKGMGLAAEFSGALTSFAR